MEEIKLEAKETLGPMGEAIKKSFGFTMFRWGS
jgi:hypothetical protein